MCLSCLLLEGIALHDEIWRKSALDFLRTVATTLDGTTTKHVFNARLHTAHHLRSLDAEVLSWSAVGDQVRTGPVPDTMRKHDPHVPRRQVPGMLFVTAQERKPSRAKVVSGAAKVSGDALFIAPLPLLEFRSVARRHDNGFGCVRTAIEHEAMLGCGWSMLRCGSWGCVNQFWMPMVIVVSLLWSL